MAVALARRWPVLPAIAALACLGAAPVTAQTLNREAEIVFQVEGGPLAALGAAAFEVLENGEARQVLAVEPVAERWRIVVYFDLPASTPEGVAAAAAAIGDAADALVALGDVEIVTADRIAEVVLEPTADPEQVLQAVAEVASRAGEAGGLLALRKDLQAAGESRSRDPDANGLRAADLLEGFLQELDTLRWQRATLLESLQGDTWAAGPPRVLFLVQDGMDLSADAFAQRLLGEPTPAFERAARSEQHRQRSLARAIAALGWRVYPLHSAPPDERVSDLLTERQRQSRELAQASGGQVVEDSEALAAAIERLGQSRRLRYGSNGMRDGAPHPVNVRVASSVASSGPPPELAARRWATVAAPSDLVALRAGQALEALARGGDETAAAGSSTLTVRTVFLAQGIETVFEGAPSELVAVDGLVTFGSRPPASSDALRVTIYGRGLDVPPFLMHRVGAGADLDRGAWRFRTLIDLPVAIDELLLMVEDLRTDRWRVTFLDQGSHPLDDRSDVELLTSDGAPGGRPVDLAEDGITRAARSSARRGGRADGASTGDRPSAYGSTVAPSPTFVRLLPPRGERSGLSGKKSFGTVTTNDAVRRVEFYLDGELVFDDRRKPFETRIDLGPEAVPHTVRVVGFDRLHRELGADELPINQPRQNIGVGFTTVEAQAGESYTVEARVELARGRTLDRVEFYRNDRLAATLTRPPFRTRLPGPGQPGTDFARVAVYLEDGTMIENVRFLSSETAVEETVVNLVEVYVVVNDEQGKPITTLDRADFALRAGRREIPIERFAVAEDVPLVLGVAVDSSYSMWTLMPDTRRAAARFLGNTLTKIDRAFLVDFDNRPRLLLDTTADIADLIGSLKDIQADGRTALYDAMQFSLVHLVRDQGRRALVVLTDGDDSGSQSSYRRTFKTAGNTGVPIYVISIQGFGDDQRRNSRKIDLEAIAEASGGRVFYVGSTEEVNEAYRRIGEELRSQYMLGYSTAAPLTSSEVQSLKVDLRPSGKDREVRITVGRGRG